MKKLFTTILCVIVFIQVAKATNFVSNGDFEASTAIGSSYWATNGSNHTFSIETSAPISGAYSAKATIGTVAASSTLQGLYTMVTLPKAATYTVTFTVKSSVDFTQNGTIGVIGQVVQSYGAYGSFGVSTFNSLTANIPKTITYDVTTTTTNTGMCKLAVYYGGLAAGATILIDNVTVTEKTGTSLTNTNLCNGDFETVSGTGLFTTTGYTYNGLTSGTPTKAQCELYYGWSLLRKGIDVATYTTANMTAAIDNTTPLSGTNSMKLTSTGTATAITSDLQFDWIFGGLKDANYTVSFKAKTDAVGGYNLRVALLPWGGGNLISEQTCALTTTAQTFTLTSTAVFAASDGRNILKFLLGTLPNGVSVWLDDIVIAVKQTPTISWTQSALSLKTTDSPVVNLTAATSNMSSVTIPASSAITYSSDNIAAVTVSGTTLNIVGAGTANITASEAADASGFYNAATPVSKAVTVNQNAFRGALISNGTFELSTDATTNVSWWQKTGTAANFTIDNTSQISGSNCAKLTATTLGSVTSCGLFQYMTLPKPSTYTVTFKAKASTACTIQAGLQQSYPPYGWITGVSSSFNLTTSTQTYSYDITTTSATGLCKFIFYFGNVSPDIYLDDVTIVEKTPLTNANLCNGDFETSMGNTIFATSGYNYNGVTYSATPDATQNSLYYGWSLMNYTSASAILTATTETGVDKISGSQSIKLTSTGTATSTSSNTQFDWIFAGMKDKQYNVYFKAKSSVATTMGVSMEAWNYVSSPSTYYLTEQTCNLTTAVQTFSFTTSNPFLQSDGRNILKFLLGKLPYNVSVWIDDVVIQPVQTAVTTPTVTWSQSLTGLSVGNIPVSLTASSDYTPLSSPVASVVTYGSSNTAVITVSGSTLTVVGAGTANVTAYQAADVAGNYSAAPAVVQSVTIAKATPTITVTPIGIYTYNGSAQGPNAVTKGGSTGAVTYSYVGVNGTSYSASATRPTSVGSYTVTATVAADANYYQASSSATGFAILAAIPGVPTAATATAGNTQASVAFTVPSSNGGSSIIDYTVTSNPGSHSATGTSSPIVVTGLSNGTAYTFTVTARNSVGSSSSSDASNYITPVSPSVTVLADANLSTYSTSAATDVTVASGELTVNADAIVKTMTVNPGGKLTLAAGKTLTVVGAIVLHSDAAHTATFVDNGGTITAGTTNVEQYLPQSRNWYISSPVTGATTPANYTVYSYHEAGDNTGFATQSGSPTLYWESIAQGTTFENGRGYIALPVGATTLNFSGTLNAGSVTTGSLTRTTGKTKEGFNLVGNPYTSYLNLIASGNRMDTTNVLATYWMRTRNQADNAYDFDTFNLMSELGISKSAKTVNGIIPPMQAFWVRVKTGKSPATLTFTKAMCQHNSDVANLFRAPSSSKITQQVLHLQLSNGVNMDETILAFNPNASNGSDAYDSPKMSINCVTIPEIFTIIGGEQIAINGMNSIPYDTEIPLGFTTGQAGTNFSIKASQLSNFDAGTQVILKDYLDINNPVINELSNGNSYSFTSAIVSNNTSRFTLTFRAPSVATGINSNENGSFWISTNANGQIIVNSNSSKNTFIAIYNAIGQKIMSKNLTQINAPLVTSLKSGVYMVTVFNAGKTVTKKIIID